MPTLAENNIARIEKSIAELASIPELEKAGRMNLPALIFDEAIKLL